MPRVGTDFREIALPAINAHLIETASGKVEAGNQPLAPTPQTLNLAQTLNPINPKP